jgi:RNA polymerase sigma-70 factor, ECF subfamily
MRQQFREVVLRLIGQAGMMEFWEIYDEHYSRVKKVILALVRDEWAADDLTQETFARVQDHLGDLRDPAKLSSWIFGIAYNLCHDHFRKVGKVVMSEDLLPEEMDIAQENSLQKEFEQRQMGKCVQKEIDRLPESLRTAVVLSDVMELSHREVAEILGITVQNVKVRVHRARKKLKELLEQKCTFEADERNVLTCEPKHTPEGEQ